MVESREENHIKVINGNDNNICLITMSAPSTSSSTCSVVLPCPCHRPPAVILLCVITCYCHHPPVLSVNLCQHGGLVAVLQTLPSHSTLATCALPSSATASLTCTSMWGTLCTGSTTSGTGELSLVGWCGCGLSFVHRVNTMS